MIFVYVALLLFGIEAAFLRGRLSRLAKLRVHRLWLVWLALVVQILVISVLPGNEEPWLALGHVGSYLLAGGFIWANRHVRGVAVVALGGFSNFTAIVLNGGTMPASAKALAASGWKAAKGHFANSAVVAHAKLAFLGDIFSTPKWLPGHDVFSLGDLTIVLGLACVIYRTCSVPPAIEQPPVSPEGTGGGEAAAPDSTLGVGAR